MRFTMPMMNPMIPKKKQRADTWKAWEDKRLRISERPGARGLQRRSERSRRLRKIWSCRPSANWNSHRPNISPVIGGYKQPSKSAQSIEITGFIEKLKPLEISCFYTLLPLAAWADKGKIKGKPRAENTIIWQTAYSDVLSQTE